MSKFANAAILGAALTLSSTAAFAHERDLAQEEANRQLVLEFYDQFFNRHQTEEAGAVVAEDYIQHNPQVPDGRAPLSDILRVSLPRTLNRPPVSSGPMPRAIWFGCMWNRPTAPGIRGRRSSTSFVSKTA